MLNNSEYALHFTFLSEISINSLKYNLHLPENTEQYFDVHN